MRAFWVSIVFVIVVAVIGVFSLNHFQESSSTAYSTSMVRLGPSEAAINDYGRGVSG